VDLKHRARPKQHAPLPAPAEKAAAVDAMFDSIAGRYDRLNRILTLGLDVAWRRTAVRALELRSDARVLDIACGTGDFCREVEAAGASVIGLDRSAGMLAAAAGTRAPLVRADGLLLPVRERSFDGITCGFALRNVVALDPLFAECARALRPGGRFAFLEVAEPERAVLRAGHRVYFRHVVPFVGGLLSDRAAYRYLPDSTAYLPSAADLVSRLTAAGFVGVTRRLLGLGAAQLLCGTAP
jgi:demethylmenaquinone methyltransferase / 2-methoxy-6-polyprenyl-1,4-benzoquinol methylase